MTIASRLKLNIWLSTALVFLLMTAFATAFLLEQEARKRSLFADQLMHGVFELSLLTDYYIRHPEVRPKRQWQIQHAFLLQLLQERRDELGETEQQELIHQSLSDIDVLFRELTKTYASGRPDDTIARQQREQLADLIIMRSRAIAETTARIAAESRADMATISRQIAVAFPVLSLLVLTTTIWLATRIRNRIVGPIEQLRRGVAILGTGNLDYRIGLVTRDELGQLADEVDRMAQRLKATTASRQELLQEMAKQQQTEAALRQSEQMFRRLAETNLVGVGFGDTQGHITYINDEMLRMMGYTRADYEAGRINWAECVAPEFRDDIARWSERLMREGRVIGYERAFLRPDGGRTPYLGAAALVTPGEALHVSLALDLTRIRAAEETLWEREEQLRIAQAAAALGIYDYDVASGTLHWDARVRELWGVGPEEPITYETFIAGLHPDERAPTQAAVERALDPMGDGRYEAEYRVVSRTDGLTRWILATGRVFFTAGRAVRLIGTVQEISDRKRAEERLGLTAERDAFRLRLSDSLRPLADPAMVQATASRVLGEQLGVNRVAYFEVKDDDYVVERDYVVAVPHLVGRFPIASFGSKLLAAYRTGEAISADDTEAEAGLSASERAAFASIQTRAYIGVPLIKEGRFVAGLVVHHSAPRAWTREELALVQETAERTWSAVERARAEATLRESEEFTRRITEVAPSILYVYDLNEHRNVWGNREMFSGLGYTREQLDAMSGRLLETLLHPDDQIPYQHHAARLRTLADDEVAEFEYTTWKVSYSILNLREIFLSRLFLSFL